MAEKRVLSNSSLALEKLRLMIHDHRDDAEFRLPAERDLASELAVGRRAVRRALEVLEADGVIRRFQGKGTFAGRGSACAKGVSALAQRTSPSEVMETRLLIEPGLARLAALRATREDIAALERLAHKTATASDDDGWELWDSAFHRRIAECAGNRMLMSVFDAIQLVRKDPDWRHLRASTRTAEGRRTNMEEHDAIVVAIASRSGQDAQRAMARHLATVDENLRRRIVGFYDDVALETERPAPLTNGASHDVR